MHFEQILQQLRSMRLNEMAASLKTRIDADEHKELSHEELIGLIVEDEFQKRKSRKLNRMIGRANFKPEQACMENLKFNELRGLNKSDVAAFTSTAWINDAKHLIITGPTGTGKTYLAEAIGLKACTMGFASMKIRYSRFFEEISTAKGTGQYSKYLQKLERVKVLIFDDFLNYKANTKELVELMDLIEDRDQRGPIIVTSQYPPIKWHERLSDPTLADAICDRLISGTRKITLKGGSMRKKRSAKSTST